MSRPNSKIQSNPTIGDDGLIHDDMTLPEDEIEEQWDVIDDSVFEENLAKQSDEQNAPVQPEDNSWLEALLDGNIDEEPADDIDPYADDTDLNALLEDVATEETIEPTTPDNRLNAQFTDPAIVASATHATRANGISTAPILWGIGCILLLLLLLTQYVIFNLDNLVKDPAYEERLQGFCGALNCALPSADVGQIAITNINHRPHAGQAKSTDIMAAISNQGYEDQLYPNLKMSIHGSSGLLGELVAEPSEYLVTPQRLLGSSQVTLFMLTVPIADSEITAIHIEPIY